MRLPVRPASSLAVVLGALLVAGLIAAPALAGHANLMAASPRRNGNDNAHPTAKAWKTRDWPSERRPINAWRKGRWASDRRLAKSCAKVAKAWRKGSGGSSRRLAKLCTAVSPGSVGRTAPVRRRTAQPTTTMTAEPTTTRPPTPTTSAPTPTYVPGPGPGPPTTTICEPTSTRAAGDSQLPSTGSRLAPLLIAGSSWSWAA